MQRIPIIALAFVGLYISRYLAAYQLGHTDSAWDPFFGDGTERIITSDVSKAWPVPDAGLGAVTYLPEILTGVIGGRARWRTMPWLVVLFGVMIVPLGAVSLFFIIIQPIVIGTWCSLCLLAAAAMLLQIPHSIDELVATGQFLLERRRRGKSVILAFLRGDTMEGGKRMPPDDFERPAMAVVRDMLAVALIFAPFMFDGGSLVADLAGVAAGILLIALSIPRGRIDPPYGGWNKYLV